MWGVIEDSGCPSLLMLWLASVQMKKISRTAEWDARMGRPPYVLEAWWKQKAHRQKMKRGRFPKYLCFMYCNTW